MRNVKATETQILVRKTVALKVNKFLKDNTITPKELNSFIVHAGKHLHEENVKKLWNPDIDMVENVTHLVDVMCAEYMKNREVKKEV